MNSKPGRKKWIPAAAMLGALLLVACVCIGVGCIYQNAEKRAAAIAREEKLDELKNCEGTFSENSIVLNNMTLEQAKLLAEQLQGRLRTTEDGGFKVLYLPEGITVADVFANSDYQALLADMELDYYANASSQDANGQEILTAKPDYTVTDPQYSMQTYLDNIWMGDSWNTSRGAGVTVAIIDTGIDTDHPEFLGRISEMSYYASEDKTVRDYGMSVIEDEVGHGTAVAGVLAASMNNDEGITGIAPEVELVIIKCDCNSSGQFLRSSDLVFGLA